jgi:hypothetical protein
VRAVACAHGSERKGEVGRRKLTLKKEVRSKAWRLPGARVHVVPGLPCAHPLGYVLHGSDTCPLCIYEKYQIYIMCP